MGYMQGNLNVDLVKKEIKQIVSRISRIDLEELEEHVLIREELGIDSLRALEIIGTCEKHLKIKIDERLFADIKTVGDFLDLLIGLLKSKEKEDNELND
jgi:acyl carrier protein